MTKIPLRELIEFPREYAPAELLTPETFVSVNSMRANRLGIEPVAELRQRSEATRPYLHQAGDILIGAINPYLRKIHLITTPGCHYHDVFCLRVRDHQQLHPAYLYHLLCREEFWVLFNQKADCASILRGNLQTIENYTVEIPSYAQQLRILDVLDPLAQYRSLVFHEEQLREQQQDYLVSQLLDLNPQVTNATQRQTQHPLASVRALSDSQIHVCELAEVAQVLRNASYIRSSDLENNPGPYPVYSATLQNNGVMGYYDKFDFEGEYLTWIVNGNHAGKFHLRQGQFSVNQHAGVLQVDSSVNLHYLCAYLNAIGSSYVARNASSTKLSHATVAQMRIALPPREVQDEIAHLLVSLQELNQQQHVSSLGHALVQLDAQLEYYRSKLMTEPFKLTTTLSVHA